jgi:Rhs element Vgr protein
MAQQRTIPASMATDLPTFTIIADGNPISREYNILSIIVSKSVNKIPFAQIMMLDGDPSSEDFPLSNEEFFVPGAEIEIEAGYHSSTETIFKGIVIKHGLKARREKPSILVVEAKDESVKMTVGRKNRYFEEVSDSEVMEEIIDEYGLSKDVESTAESHKEMVQYYSTDWDFVVSRAEKNGMLVMCDDGEVKIKKPTVESEGSLMLVYGATVLDFEMEMDARNQFSSIKSESWEYSTQVVVETDSADPGIDQAGNLRVEDLAGVVDLDELDLRHGGYVSEQELQAWADAAAMKSALSKIRGRVKCQGFSDIKPGDTLEIEGIGDRFNGMMFASGVAHQFSDNQWFTDIYVGLDPKWFSQKEEIIDDKAAGLLPGINGLQIGIVTDLEDPDGEDRVKVKLPMISTEDEGVWTRVASLDAGDNRGAYFRPEIDDEVIIGFINDDPRDPVILGMLNSSAKPAPITGSNDNHEKGFVTRSEMKVIFNDDEISTTIETPNGNKIVLTDQDGGIFIEDENGNKMEMTSDGILIESPADINIKASGDVNIEGININAKASAQLVAEGSASAEFKAGGNATIQGAIVQIN